MRTSASVAVKSVCSKPARRSRNRCARNLSNRKTGRTGREDSLTRAVLKCPTSPTTNDQRRFHETHSLLQIRARSGRRNEHGRPARRALGLPAAERVSGFHVVRNAGGRAHARRPEARYRASSDEWRGLRREPARTDRADADGWQAQRTDRATDRAHAAG